MSDYLVIEMRPQDDAQKTMHLCKNADGFLNEEEAQWPPSPYALLNEDEVELALKTQDCRFSDRRVGKSGELLVVIVGFDLETVHEESWEPPQKQPQ